MEKPEESIPADILKSKEAGEEQKLRLRINNFKTINLIKTIKIN